MKYMGNSLNKNKEWSVTNSPIIKLKVDKKEPKFNATEAVKIRITAECHNVTIPKNGLEYEWSYVDSTGFMKSFTTKKGVVMLHCPNFFCGRVMTIKVKVNLEFSKFDEKIKFSSFDFGKFDTLEDTIEIKPQCNKKLSDNAEWLPDEVEMPNCVQSSVTLYGYNGSEMGLVRMIKEKGKIIWKGEDKVMVRDNVVSALFNRNHCTSSTADDSIYTLQFQLTDARNGSLLKSYSRDYTIKGREAIKPLAGCPIQPVVVGDITIAENNFKPCKYTQIDVEYTKDKEGKEKQKMTVFKEGLQSTNTVKLIGGERKITVTLLEYTPKKCTLKENSHKKKEEVPFMLYGENKSKLPISVSGKTGKIENIKIKYNYGIINAIKTLWLPMSGIVQTSKLYTSYANCRHFNDVIFNMYPDTKWEAFVELSSSKPRLYSHTNMPAEYSIFERHQKKALSAAKEDKDIGLSFSLMATYDDDIEIKLTADIEKSVKTVSHVLKTIRDALDVLSFKKSVDDNKDKLKARNVLPKSSKLPVFIEISSPVLKIGGGWQYDLNSENQLIRKGEIAIAASPLIEAKGGIDLIACSTFIPVVGQIIKAILKLNDFAEWATKYLSNDKAKYEGLIWFNIYLKGSLSIVGTVKLSEENRTVKFESPVNIVFVVELGISAEVKVETVTITGNNTYTVRAGASGEASTGLTFKPSMGYSTDEGIYLGFKVSFDGIILTVSGEAKFEQKKKGKKTLSIGPEINGEPLPPLIAPCSIWKGEVYPFRETNKK